MYMHTHGSYSGHRIMYVYVDIGPVRSIPIQTFDDLAR